MTILVIGSTGTLGRQIVRELLKHGIKTNCLVRNFKKANFLKEWGANLTYGDLRLPETIPNNLKGIKTIIDCSTFRSEEEINTLEEIDLIGKLALINSAKIAKIENFFFFSIKGEGKYENVSFFKLKKKIQNSLKCSNLNYTIFQIDGFYQGLITQYAIPTLEQQKISIFENSNQYYYINTEDVAKILVKLFLYYSSLTNIKNKIIEINGPKIADSEIIIKLTEEFSGQKTKVEKISQSFLEISKNVLSLGSISKEIYNRLSFNKIFNAEKNSLDQKKLKFTDETIIVKKQDITFLDNYLEEYFKSMLEKLRTLNYDQSQISKRKNLIF